MNVTFTPAAQRALRAAAAWRDPDDSDGLGPLAVLMGLLAEDECRAAQMLSDRGIDARSVGHRWPRLTQVDTPTESSQSSLAPAVLAALRVAGRRLGEHPQPLEYATEHLLLGLTLVPSELSDWLAERGLAPDAITQRLEELYGISNELLPMEEAAPLELEQPAAAPPTIVAPSAGDRHAALRIFDAAANRAAEALRVVEDCARMALDDRHLTECLKKLRHDLTTTLAPVPMAERLVCRDTLHDVGTSVTVPDEQRRGSLAHVFAANFARLEQSLRTLEELGKLLHPALGPQIEALRYRAYTYHKAIEQTRDAALRLASVRLYVLIDGRPTLAEFERLAATLIAEQVDALQLRDKRLADRELLMRARLLRQMTVGTRTLMVVNDRPDLAALTAADGVHVGQEELTVSDVRRVVGSNMLVGVSTHSVEQARQAVLEGASYIGVGPVFPSGTKRFETYPGLELVRQVAAEIRLPALAIGGIGPENVAQVLAAGLGQVAVGAAICNSPDPAGAARQLARQIHRPT